MSDDAIRRPGCQLPHLWVLLLPVVLLTAALPAASAVRAQSSATISPEEAFAYLQGYSLTAATVPVALRREPLDRTRPVIQALADSRPRLRVCTLQRSGLIVGGEQLLRRGAAIPSRLASCRWPCSRSLAGSRLRHRARTPTPVRRYVHRPAHRSGHFPRRRCSRLAPVAGRPSGAFAIEGYELLWHHGSVVLSAVTLGMPGSVQIADLQAIAAAIEKRFAAAGPLPVHPPAITPPATEQERLDQASSLAGRPRRLQAPKGFDDIDLAFLHPADSVVRTGDRPPRCKASARSTSACAT